MANIGMVIDGKYEIIAEIGRGGMSVVYLAIDRRLNKQWAVKEAKKKPGQDSEIFELTPIAEANLLKSLDHPNIVRIVDIIEQGGYIYIVEDFVEGKSLSEEVKKGPTSPDDVVLWGSQLCDTFDYLHSRRQPIIYRDMKPANVQLQPDRKKVKLLDFGIAKTYKENNVGDTRNLGTRGYAAPEQFDVNKQSDRRTDVFSLGVTLRALLMGKTPYDAEFYDDIRKQNPAVTDGLVKVITKATDPDPKKRYQTAAEFKNALIHYHDRDAAVIRMKKRKLSSFRGLMASSISFLLAGIIILPFTYVARNSDYKDHLNSDNIETIRQCFEIDASRYEAYFRYLGYDDSDKDDKKNTKKDDYFSAPFDVPNIADSLKRQEFTFVAALGHESETNEATLVKQQSAKKYYRYILNDFEYEVAENGTIQSVYTGKLSEIKMKDVLTACNGDSYKEIAAIKLYYIKILENCSGDDNKDPEKKKKDIEDVSAVYDTIKMNIADINSFLDESNRKSLNRLTDDKISLDGNDANSKSLLDYADFPDKVSGVNDLLDYWQVNCFIAIKGKLNDQQCKDIVSVIGENKRSDYIKNTSDLFNISSKN